MLKRAYILFFIALIIFQTFDRFGMVAYYQINKEYITEYFCINKDKPEMNCDGMCFLSMQLAEQQQEREQAPFRDFEKKKMQYFFEDESENDNLITFKRKNAPIFDYVTIHSQPFYKEDIDPPRI